jgi:hypothetical protein
MTQPMPVYLEPWINSPAASDAVTVPAGALPRPAGTSELWTMAGRWDMWPDANPGARPPRVFRLFDPADPREIIWVTNTSGTLARDELAAGARRDERAGSHRARAALTNVWRVTRSAEGSVPNVAHAPGFEVRPFLTKASMDGRARGTPNGLTWRNGLNPEVPTVPYGWTDAATHVITQVEIPAGEAIPASLYELNAWGYYSAGTTQLTMGVDWYNPPPSGARVILGAVGHATAGAAGSPLWRVHAAVNLHSVQANGMTTCSVSIMLWCAINGTNQSLAVPVLLYGNLGEPQVDARIPALLRLYCARIPAGFQMAVQGTRAGRAA